MKRSFRFKVDDTMFQKGVSMKPLKAHALALVTTLVLAFAAFYVYLPVINIKDQGSVIFLSCFIFLYGIFDGILCGKMTKIFRISSMVALGLMAMMIVGSIWSMEVFHASELQAQIQVDDTVDFTKDFKEISLSKIPVVDKDVAIVMGDKKLGEVQGLGSQFDIDNTYTLVTIRDQIYRVAPLEYQSMIKWFQNREEGIPSYVKVNVNDPSDVTLVTLPQGMKLSPSAYFHENLWRFVRMKYPTAMIQNYSFEIDDQDNPYWVLSVYEPKIGMYSGLDATGVILVNPITKESKRYAMDEVPEWVDRVQPAEFAITQIDNWGYYIHGYFNTMFGQKDMLQVTDGYNYVAVDGNTHIFTGITSVGSDQSIVGFTLIDLRTKKAKFYRIGGADEYSAMSSAEGQVQHLNYRATFPIILNVNGTPSYFVSLKDQEGLVKKYAFVAVRNYSYVGVGDTVQEAQANYLSLLHNSGLGNDTSKDPKETVTGKVALIESAIVNGNTIYYMLLEDQDTLFIVSITTSNELAITKVGDEVRLEYYNTDSNAVNAISFDNHKYQY